MNFKRLRWVVSLPEHATAVSGAKRTLTKIVSWLAWTWGIVKFTPGG
jgi:hypothetical protein